MNCDLHCHSTASDGELSVEALLALAQEREIDMLAITDHDTDIGYRRARKCDTSVRLISGVEFSCTWGKMSLHVVGLNMDVDTSIFVAAMARQSKAREQRAHIIADKLQKIGIEGAYEGALAFASAKDQIGRPHFAQYLLQQGSVRTMNEAFKKYLGAGKPGDVKALWPDLETVIEWINSSGGVAVVAHPLRYKMTRTKLRHLLTDFGAMGGRGVEVACANQTTSDTQTIAKIAQDLGLLASRGSDFHGSKMPWNALGRAVALTKNCEPVWQLF